MKKWVIAVCVFCVVAGVARGDEAPFVESLDAAAVAHSRLDDAAQRGMLLGNGTVSAVVSMEGTAVVVDVARKTKDGGAPVPCVRAVFGDAAKAAEPVPVAARLELHRAVASIRSRDGKVPETVVRVLAQRDVVVVDTALTGRLEPAPGSDAGAIALAASAGRTVIAVAVDGKAEELARGTLAEDWAGLRAGHDAAWTSFWSHGGIEIGDAALSDAWYRGRYRGRCLGVDAERKTEALLLGEENGVVKLFPEWPPDRPAKFADLPAGGFLVSASLEEGKVTLVKAVCTGKGTLRLISPWPNTKAKVNGKEATNPGQDGQGAIGIDAAEGDVIVLREDRTNRE